MNTFIECKAFRLTGFISDHLQELELNQILAQISKSDEIEIYEMPIITGHSTKINFNDNSFILINRNNLNGIIQIIGFIRDDTGILRNTVWDK